MKTCRSIRCGPAHASARRQPLAAQPKSPRIHPAIQAAIDSPDRPEKDRARDANRHYGEMLEFFGVRPGRR